MAKKPANKAKQAQTKPEVPDVVEEQSVEVSGISFTKVLNHPIIPYLIILLFSASLYLNTIGNQYTLDDTLVLRSNKFTLKGFAGIKDLMTHDAFVGFWGEVGGQLVSGGRYRPLSMVTLAVEVQLFGQNPKISHTINIILFSLTCLLLYHLLRRMLPTPKKKDAPFYFSIPFIATMIYAGHPIHTEVVANIKGRDEIMALLFALLALFAGLKYVKTQNILHLVWGAVMLFLGLLSKENVVMFMAIIPFSYYFFTNANFKNYMVTVGLYLIPVFIFLYLRDHYTKSAITSESSEILNNSWAYLPKSFDGTLQKYATIIMTFILYFKLLIFPHPLTHDYNYNQIPIIGPTDPVFILSFIVNTALAIYALMGLKKKALTSYAIIFYFTTFIIVSNLFFPLGTLMNERFAYVSSIGFALIVGWLFIKARERFKLPFPALGGILVVILALYSFKTITRNTVWYDNLTLFLVDCKTSSDGAKVQLATGVELEDLADRNFVPLRKNGYLQKITNLMDMNVDVATIPDSTMRKELLKKALKYIDRSLEIYPTRYGAWLVKGNTVYKLNKDAKEAIRYFDSAIAFSSSADYESLQNEANVEIENRMPGPAIPNLHKARFLKPEEYQPRYMLGLAYSNLRIPDSSLYWFQKSIEIEPKNSEPYYQMGLVYGKQLSKPDQAIEKLTKAIEYNPNVELYYEDLGENYTNNNMPDDAIKTYEQCLKKFPKAVAAMKNIAVVYDKKGNAQMSAKYNDMRRQVEDSSLYAYEQIIKKNPNDAEAYYQLGTLYGKQKNDLGKAIEYFILAIQHNPNVPLYYEDLGVAYGFKNMPDESIRISEECLKRFPDYTPALRNISISYNKKGDLAKGQEYDRRVQQILSQKH